MPKFIDLTGEKFGRLTVLQRTENKNKRPAFKCKCDCGNEVVVTSDSLRSGNTKSCGCIQKEKVQMLNFKDGRSSERLYKVYCGMKQRCYYKKHDQYKNYGGKGVYICDEWLNDYESFRKWSIENGYDENADHFSCTIDRIDSQKPYCPENCRWVSQKVQSNNISTNVIIEYNGESHTISEWADILNVDYKAFRGRYNRGWSIERMFTQKYRKSRKD